MINDNSHIEFLENRLKEIWKRIAATEDYKAAKALKAVLVELKAESHATIVNSTQPELPSQELVNQHLQLYNLDYDKKIEIKSDRSAGYLPKDMGNSPLPNVPYGQRIDRTYDIVEQVVIDNGGSIHFRDLVEWLKDIHNMDWIDKNNKDGTARSRHSRIVSYIQIYNRKNPDNIRLHLWPERPEGSQRMGRYEKVIYVGKQRMAV